MQKSVERVVIAVVYGNGRAGNTGLKTGRGGHVR